MRKSSKWLKPNCWCPKQRIDLDKLKFGISYNNVQNTNFILFMVAFYLLNFTSLGKKPEGKQFNFGKVGNSIAAQLDIKMKPGNPINFNKFNIVKISFT